MVKRCLTEACATASYNVTGLLPSQHARLRQKNFRNAKLALCNRYHRLTEESDVPLGGSHGSGLEVEVGRYDSHNDYRQKNQADDLEDATPHTEWRVLPNVVD